MSNRTSLRMRVLPRFPARISATNGLAIDQENTDLVVKPDFGSLVIVPSVSTPEATFFWGWDQSIGMYSRISFQNLVNNIQDVIIGPTTAAMEATSPTTDQFIYFTGPDAAAVKSIYDFATAAQGSKADTALQAVDLSSTVQYDKGLKPKNFFDMPTLDADDGLFIFHGEGKTSPTDGFSLRVDRRADYITPGTFGYLNAALLVKSEITGQTSAFETGLAIIQNNYANVGGTWDTTPQHHAAVFQANRYGTAPTWGLVIEAIDRQFAANPVTGILGIELDVQGAGTDANNNKVGIAMVNRRQGGLSGWSGPANEMGYGIYLVKQPDDAANNRYKIGIGFGVAAAPTEFDVGLDFISANLTIAALRMKANQNVAWVADATRKTYYDAGSARLRYQAPGGKVFDMLDGGEFSITGSYQIFGTQVVTSRRTGWTADTGTAKRTANATYSATAEAAYTQATIQALMDKVRDLSQTIKALKDDLIAHGLIGA